MSRWSKAFAAFSGGSDTLDTMGHSGDQHPTVSQSVDSVTANVTVPCRPIRYLPSWASWIPDVSRESTVLLTDDANIEITGGDLRERNLMRRQL